MCLFSSPARGTHLGSLGCQMLRVHGFGRSQYLHAACMHYPNTCSRLQHSHIASSPHTLRLSPSAHARRVTWAACHSSPVMTVPVGARVVNGQLSTILLWFQCCHGYVCVACVPNIHQQYRMPASAACKPSYICRICDMISTHPTSPRERSCACVSSLRPYTAASFTLISLVCTGTVV